MNVLVASYRLSCSHVHTLARWIHRVRLTECTRGLNEYCTNICLMADSLLPFVVERDSIFPNPTFISLAPPIHTRNLLQCVGQLFIKTVQRNGRCDQEHTTATLNRIVRSFQTQLKMVGYFSKQCQQSDFKTCSLFYFEIFYTILFICNLTKLPSENLQTAFVHNDV